MESSRRLIFQISIILFPFRSVKFQLSTKNRDVKFFYAPKTPAIYMLIECRKKCKFDRRELDFCTS